MRDLKVGIVLFCSLPGPKHKDAIIDLTSQISIRRGLEHDT